MSVLLLLSLVGVFGWPVDDNPSLVPLTPNGASLVGQLQQAASALGLGMTWNGSDLNGIRVYGNSETEQARARSGYDVKGGLLSGITDSEVWIAFDLDYLAKLVQVKGLEGAVEFYTVALHEWHHAQSHDWQIEQCKALPPGQQADCQACVQGMDDCLKGASLGGLTGCDPTLSGELKGKNLPEEARAAYGAFLCLCIASCAAANAGDHELADALGAKAAQQLAAAQCAWNNSGTAQIGSCQMSTGCAGAYPPAIPPGSGPSGEGFSGPPASVTSCDCDQPPELPEGQACPPAE